MRNISNINKFANRAIRDKISEKAQLAEMYCRPLGLQVKLTRQSSL